jgi:hypothetical protein
MSDIKDFKTKDTQFSGTEGIQLPQGTTAERPASGTGRLRFNTDNGLMEVYDGTQWVVADTPPQIISVSPNQNDPDGVTLGSTAIVITGTGFKSGAIVDFIDAANASNSFRSPSVTVDSSTQLTVVLPATLGSGALYDLKVANTSGLTGTLEDAYTLDDAVAWTTAASLGDTQEQLAYSYTLVATDSDAGANITYSVQSGTPPAGYNLNPSTGVLSGTAPNVSNDTVYTFTVRASSDRLVSTADREFTLNVVANPEISSVADGSGNSSPAFYNYNNTLSVTGTSFNTGVTATIGGTSASVTRNSSTSLTITPPNTLTPGSTNDLVITNTNGGTVTASNAVAVLRPYLQLRQSANTSSISVGGSAVRIGNWTSSVAYANSGIITSTSSQITLTKGGIYRIHAHIHFRNTATDETDYRQNPIVYFRLNGSSNFIGRGKMTYVRNGYEHQWASGITEYVATFSDGDYIEVWAQTPADVNSGKTGSLRTSQSDGYRSILYAERVG